MFRGVSLCLALAALAGTFAASAANARRSLSEMTAAERARLAQAILGWLDDKKIVAQEMAFHLGENTEREDHAAYVAALEELLKAPLPAWSPDAEIPEEFLAVKPMDAGRPRRAIRKRRARPFPLAAQLRGESLCRLPQREFESKLSLWHDFVLEDLGGAADSEESAAAPLAWCWHAYLAEVGRRRRACAR